MVSFRLAVVLLALGSVSAQQSSLPSFVNAVFSKVMQLVSLGQTQQHLHEDAHQDEGNIDHHKHWHDKMRKKMEEAHACHMKCGADSACHSKCPKPWAPFVKACQDFPAILACHATCEAADCEACPKFDMTWMNKKFAKNPERYIKKAEAKCPMVLEAHACHKACTPGDHACHHKCPSFHGHHGDDHHHGDHHHREGWHHQDHHDGDHHHHRDWHQQHHKGWQHHDHHGQDHKDGSRHGEDQKHWHKRMHKKMEEAHACHMKCGKDSACHSKCPKPWAPFVKACQDVPAILACHSTCEAADCETCPKFDMTWMNKKFAQNPERVAKMAAVKCPKIQKAHDCHKTCSPGDYECHRKCLSMHGHHGWHHGLQQTEAITGQSEHDPQDPILV